MQTLPLDVLILTLEFCDFETVLNASLTNKEWYTASTDDTLWRPRLRTHNISNAQQQSIAEGSVRSFVIKTIKQNIKDTWWRETRKKFISFRYKQSKYVHSSFTWCIALSIIIMGLRDVLCFRTKDAFVPLWFLLFATWVYWLYTVVENIVISERKLFAVPITSGIFASLLSAFVIMIYYNACRNGLSWLLVLFPIYTISLSFSAILLSMWQGKGGDVTYVYLALCFSCVSAACVSFSMFYKRIGIVILTAGNVSAIQACKKKSMRNYDAIVMQFFIALIVCQLSLYFGMNKTSLVWLTGGKI